MTAEPAAAVDAAVHAVDVLLTLSNTCGQPGTPAAGHVETLKVLAEAAKLLASLLPAEAKLASRSLTLPEDPRHGRAGARPPVDPGAAAAAAGNLRNAAHHADEAAGQLHNAWKNSSRILQAASGGREPDRDGGTTLRIAQAARRALVELKNALAAAGHRAAAWSPALLNGHRTVVHALLQAVTRLALACDRLRDPVGHAFTELGPGGRKQKASDDLAHAAAAFRRARGGIRKASAAFPDSELRRHTAPENSQNKEEAAA